MTDFRDPYMNDAAEISTGPRGQIANRVLLEHRRSVDPHAVAVGENLYCLMGINICNTQLAVGPEGVVVIDTGRSAADGESILRFVDDVVGRPVVAVVYTHSHYTLGTAPIVERYPDIPIVAHHKVHRNVVASLTGARRFMQRRARMESARYLPDDGPDADSAGSRIFNPGAMGYVRPTVEVVRDGEELLLGGERFVIHTRYSFDTDDTLLIWLPAYRAIIHNHFASNFPNVYPIQGGRYRDPEPWLAGIDRMRRYRPRHITGTHGEPDSGEERCRERLTAMRDALQFIHDQTIRGMNRHLRPDELTEFVRLPEALRGHRDLLQTYGEASNHVRGVYSGLAGWFDGDAASIHPPPRALEAARVIEAFGGVDRAIERLRGAIDRHEYAWAARIGQWLLTIAADRPEVRAAQAAALRSLGRVASAWTVRNYYLSAARALEGRVTIGESERTVDTEFALTAPSGTFVRALGYRARPERFPDGETTFGVRFRETGARHALVLRRGVAEYLEEAPEVTDCEIECDRTTWIEYVDRIDPFVDIVGEQGVELRPDRDAVRRVLSLFD